MDENDHKVVTFRNIASFEFTPALGAMFNSRPIFGKVEAGKIVVGEELFFPLLHTHIKYPHLSMRQWLRDPG